MVVHGQMVIPSIVISHCIHELCMKVCVVIILCTYVWKHVRVCMYVLMFINIEISI